MNTIILKKLDMSKDIDKKILLTYFFKKPNTTIDKNELFTMSCIYYDAAKQSLHSRTKRFAKELEPYKNKKILNKDVDSILKNILSDSFKIQEELVRCDFNLETGIDHFYVATIGVDFFQVETELRNPNLKL